MASMEKTKEKTEKKVSFKKKLQQQITATLDSSLSGLKDILGQKKFDSRIRKAAKLLSEGIKENATQKVKKDNKKTSKKKTDDTGPAEEN